MKLSELRLKNLKKKKLLNLGSGESYKKGWINIDLYNEKADIQSDISQLDYKDNSVDEIMAIHVLEHFEKKEGLDCLKEWHRVLKPDSTIKLELPDMVLICSMFLDSKNPYEWWVNTIYGSQDGKGQLHKWGYSYKYLKECLESVGFKNVKRLVNPRDWEHFFVENLCVEGVKK